MDKALITISDIENILSSIGNNDPFLKSIKVALNHIVFSMKGHIILQLGLFETMVCTSVKSYFYIIYKKLGKNKLYTKDVQ